jgi:hypothetical protein
MLQDRRIGLLRSTDEAVSLLELAIVLACAAVILTLALPSADHIFQEWRLLGAARLMETSLLWGRMHAITGNQPLLFKIEPDGRGYYWMDATTLQQFGSSVRTLPGKIRIVHAPRRPLRFFQHGNAAPAGSYVLRGAAGEYRVVVSPAGRIRLEKK